jgi:hypothetical protein
MKKSTASTQITSTLPRIVLVDANIFFAPRLRDLFMHFHEEELINVHWTKEIEGEWTRNVIAKQDADPAAIKKCLEGMRAAAPGWEVNGYRKFIGRFPDVDEKDRHVAAAAYKLSRDEWPGQPVALVTKNVKDFPNKAFQETEISRYPMASFLNELYQENSSAVLKVAEICRKKLKSPKLTKEQYIAVLVKNGCIEFAKKIADEWKVECPAIDKNGNLFYEDD